MGHETDREGVGREWAMRLIERCGEGVGHETDREVWGGSGP